MNEFDLEIYLNMLMFKSKSYPCAYYFVPEHKESFNIKSQ